MRRITFPKTELKTALSLLLSGNRFEVLAQATSSDGTLAAFVLGRFGWSWGHFYRSAFCTFVPSDSEQATLEISYLDVQRHWHGHNPFKGSDRGIEDDIANYARAAIRDAKPA